MDYQLSLFRQPGLVPPQKQQDSVLIFVKAARETSSIGLKESYCNKPFGFAHIHYIGK